ncbi:hypothetical protein AgCh_008540 [Apium graveolens]
MAKKEKEEAQRLLTKEEWQRRSNSRNRNNTGDYRTGKEGLLGGRDKSKRKIEVQRVGRKGDMTSMFWGRINCRYKRQRLNSLQVQEWRRKIVQRGFELNDEKQYGRGAKKALELVHGDLYGPITPETSGGNRFFLLLVDDYNRATWVFLLKAKDKAFEAFQKFRTQVEKGSENKVKSLHTDRGGDFCPREFNTYCEQNGIYRQFTAPYTLQQNGVVERRNYTIVIRSFLKATNLPSYLWGEAVGHSVYFLNRFPTRALTEKTPYEALTGENPNLEYLKVFGCVSYMKIPSV